MLQSHYIHFCLIVLGLNSWKQFINVQKHKFFALSIVSSKSKWSLFWQLIFIILFLDNQDGLIWPNSTVYVEWY